VLKVSALTWYQKIAAFTIPMKQKPFCVCKPGVGLPTALRMGHRQTWQTIGEVPQTAYAGCESEKGRGNRTQS